MSRPARLFGIARSLAMYYGVPFHARRLRALYSRFVVPSSLCFDIGSHAGNRVRCWRRLGARVIAVEPQRDFVRLLELLYGRDPQVEIVAAALGESAGSGTLLVSERTPTVTTLSADWVQQVQRAPGFEDVRWSSAYRVELLTLDSLIEQYGLPRFVKIDVEGYEAEVLAGLTAAVPALSFEYLPVARQVAIECIGRLETLGRYRFNWSLGESHRLAAHDWLSPADMSRVIMALPAGSPSGDIYAVLEVADVPAGPRRPSQRGAARQALAGPSSTNTYFSAHAASTRPA